MQKQKPPTHPLAPVVLSAFTDREATWDATKIAYFLNGSSWFHIPARKIDVFRAYRIVAEHVLVRLHEEGHLKKLPDGWYQLIPEDTTMPL